MKNIFLLCILTFFYFLSCKSESSQQSIFIQNLQEDNHKIKVIINGELLADLFLEKDQTAESYSYIKCLNECRSLKKITIQVGNDSLEKVVPNNKFRQVFVIISDLKSKRDYNNSEIFNHLKEGKYQNFNELVDSLYDNKIIVEKYTGKPITIEFR
jgi:hypothetical protein